MLSDNAVGQMRAPLSMAQERLWFLMQLTPGTSAYTIPFVRRLWGPLDTAALTHALRHIVTRHACLRTTFPVDRDGRPHQLVAAEPDVGLDMIDLSDGSSDERESRLRTELRGRLNRPIDLATGPLFRADLFRFGDDHVLAIYMHHLVTDGWSLDLLENELAAAYTAITDGREPDLPSLPVQYADYAVLQRDRLRGAELDRHLAYWRRELSGLEPLEVPTDHARPPKQSFAGDSVRTTLGSATTAAIRDLCAQERATPFMVLFAAFVVLLGRYADQTDVSAGVPVAGRTTRDVRHLLGFFVNTLVVRVDLAAAKTFRDVLRAVRSKMIGAHAHQEMPFAHLVKELNVARDLSRNPLFNVAFTVEPGIAQTALRWADITVEPVRALSDTVQFDLDLYVELHTDEARCTFTFATALFEPATVRRLAERYRQLVEGLIADPDAAPDAIPLTGPAECHQLLHDWADAGGATPQTTITALFESQAARAPRRPAVTGDGRSLSYRELDLRATRLARRLISSGVGPERVVALALRRSPELIVALLATLKAGGAFLPLDPIYPAQRMRHMIAETDAVLVLTDPPTRPALPEVDVPVILVEPESGAEVTTAPPAELDGARKVVRPDNLAYVIYTSGSTGTPKGVMGSHRALVRLLTAARGFLDVDEDLAIAHVPPLTFDAALLDVLLPLITGGRIVVDEPGRLLENVPRIVRDNGVNTLTVISPQLPLLLTADPADLASLRQVVVGGDVVSPVHVERFAELLPGRRLVNGYGPTENATLSTVHPIDLTTPPRGRIPIGRPLASSQAYLLDRRLYPVPVGLVGEICVAGDGLARGYFARPDLTAERFRPNPYGPPGGRLYRTGDLGRHLADGDIDFLGRRDSQVKIRGYRVEVGEIETLLARYPGVGEAAVLIRGDGDDRALVAYVAPGGPGPADPGPADSRPADPGPVDVDLAGLAGYLRRHLPDYMVPRTVVPLERLPLTNNGKVDRAALLAIATHRPPTGGGALTTATQRTVAEAWRELLGVDGIGPDDDFFELGGHSMLVPRLTAELRLRTGVEVPLRSVFDTSVLSEFAAQVDRIHAVTALRPAATWSGSVGALRGQLVSDELIDGVRDAVYPVRLYLPPASETPTGLLVIHNVDLFVDLVRAPAIIDSMVVAGTIQPVGAVFVDWIEAHPQRPEAVHRADAVSFVTTTVIPWARQRLAAVRPLRVVIAGASAGAVAAVSAAVHRPDVVDAVIGQSGPYSWVPEGRPVDWLAARLAAAATRRTAFYLSAGDRESSDPDPQRAAIPGETRALAASLSRDGYDVQQAEFTGGHDASAWQQDFGHALRAVLGRHPVSSSAPSPDAD